jgi:hypothetical protein
MQSPNSKPHPSGTAKMNRMAERMPWFAASAVDKVVFGPGVKLAAVDKTSKAVSSSEFSAKVMLL